ncbi:disease resistance protein At4g27190 [Gossypium hirsutum]|uniref:Disease resistance protein At4g27190 n=1 Tax=Gossypium hirsutum TaxID=3635 RepID=A0ABM3A1I6_GOSHI|nr:disease resistance protein At4g27190-like [Gossypium hirsutum]
MAMEYVEPVVGIAYCLGTPVCKYLQYHRKLNDYVRNFKRIRDELNCKMEDIELQLKAELLRPLGKIPKKGVENWLKAVKKMIREAQVVENKVSNGRYLCRTCNGKLVDEKTREMKEFLNNAPNASEGLAMDGPSAGLPLPTSELVGEEPVRNEIWACLMQEEVRKIGVWGMGGVGKTTIMKHIHNGLLKQQRFERVIWVTISKEFNVMKVQDDIADALKLKEDWPREGDKLRRAAILSEMLKKAGKHVLILDDVWDKVSLEEVGIPEPSGSNGCKLVLTTRSEHVCKYMGCKVIKVTPLSEEEALILFLNKVGPNIVQSPTIMPTLKLVVKECAGLPLTIVVVAGTLKGEDNPLIWKNALGELKERIGKVEGVEAEVIERLKFSFDHLKDEKVKYCFLHCALYPEDFEIENDELIECWIDEGFIDDMGTRQEMKDKGHVILKKLGDNCLLENITNHIFGQPRIKMHDAVRDMALSITSMDPRYIVQAGLELKELPKRGQWSPDIEKVSLMHNSITEFPADVLPTKCQLLTTLLLQNNPIKKISISFFTNMPCLSVLNLSFTKIESLPNSISELKNLTTLLLCGCNELRDLPCLSMLQELKKLDLYRTKIEEVPEGMDMLIKLRYLDLSVRTLKEIPVGLLPKLVHLQHLSFAVNNEKISLKAEEMEPLKKLEWFTGRFEDMNELNKFISSMQQSKKNLIKYHLHVGLYFMPTARDKTVTIEGVQNWEGELIMHPIEIQGLNIVKCDYLRNLVDGNSSFKNAMDLRIYACKGIECVVPLSSFASSSAHPFQSLEVLDLRDLPKLSALIMKDTGIGSATTSTLAPSTTFSHLQKIYVRRCSSMKTLLPHWLLPNLQNLEEIWVSECDEIVEILGAATSEVEEKGSDALIKFHLPKLRELSLSNLPNLKSICSKSGVMVCDSLQLIRITRCDKLKRIPPFVPLVGNGQPFAYAPPSLTIRSSTEWWEWLEWDDHPNYKNVLQPLWKDKSYSSLLCKIVKGVNFTASFSVLISQHFSASWDIAIVEYWPAMQQTSSSTMEYVEPVLGIAKCFGPPVCKYLKYHRKLNDYVRNFKRIKDELNCKMEDIELQLKTELLCPLGEIPKQGVENWLTDVKETIREAQVVENKVSNGRYLCRACNGKLVDEKT